tara:strand:+ start:901 stop:1173 length:273 start_codon:yes stop_codon:yes gene_type:complete
MKFEVLISETVVKKLSRLEEQDKLKQHIAFLGEDPFRFRPLADIKKLKGFSKPSLYRLRVGDFRVIYAVEGESVKVTNIFRRGKGYKWLD